MRKFESSPIWNSTTADDLEWSTRHTKLLYARFWLEMFFPMDLFNFIATIEAMKELCFSTVVIFIFCKASILIVMQFCWQCFVIFNENSWVCFIFVCLSGSLDLEIVLSVLLSAQYFTDFTNFHHWWLPSFHSYLTVICIFVTVELGCVSVCVNTDS